MKTFLQPIALFATIFFIALAVLAMAACLAEDTVTPAVQVSDSAEGILPSRPQPPGPSPVEVEGWRRDKDKDDCEKKKDKPVREGFKRFVGGALSGAGRLFFGAGDAIAAYLGFPMFVMRTVTSILWLGVFALIVVLIRTFKGK